MMAAGLKTIIALSFVCLTVNDQSPHLSPFVCLPNFDLGPSHRLPPRYPILRPLSQLPHLTRRRNIRMRPLAELDMPTMRQSR